MKRMNALALLDESRKIVSLTVLAALAAGAVVLLERAGGPLAAILGSVSVGLAARLLYIAAVRPDDQTRREAPRREDSTGRSSKSAPTDNTPTSR